MTSAQAAAQPHRRPAARRARRCWWSAGSGCGWRCASVGCGRCPPPPSGLPRWSRAMRPDISYALLAEAALAVRAGAWFVASNTDATLPTARGPQPGNGSLVQVIVTATGHAAGGGRQAGAAAARRGGGAGPAPSGRWWSETGWTPTSRARSGSGADSMLVLTGVSRRPTRCSPRRTSGPPTWPPTWAGCSSRSRTVTASGGRVPAAAAGPPAWPAVPVPTARPASSRSRAPAQPIDGLRALCAAAWSARPGQRPKACTPPSGSSASPADIASLRISRLRSDTGSALRPTPRQR